MKFVLFLLATFASTAELAAAGNTVELRDCMDLLDSLYDSSECFSDCNDKYLGKKSNTKTKKIKSELESCYETCVYNKDGSETIYGRSIGEDGIEEVLSCTGKCAKDAEKVIEKEEKNTKKNDSKDYQKCVYKCDDEDKNCVKKCDKAKDKANDKAEEDAKKKALKDANNCNTKCLEDELFHENIFMDSAKESE